MVHYYVVDRPQSLIDDSDPPTWALPEGWIATLRGSIIKDAGTFWSTLLGRKILVF